MTPRQQDRPPRAGTAPEDFTEFYRAHFHRIAVQLYAYLGDHGEAQDLTQEAFCRALERWSRVAAYDDPSAFVRRVAWNLATSRLRRVRTAVRHLARQREEHVPGPEPDRVVLLEALSTLPADQRRAIVLHHLAHLSVAEIAAQVGAPEGTVRSRLSRGRAALAGHLTETGSESRRA
ncbi:SigE family RNA polymerase sigma factor [Micromonospora robiginosa]|uniref:SigE family RNA polymerase sigma factor n=1 Tax=Micromonospora robiginosa TaxID=2749844 RepID=A0A7L6B9R6_9ACTN|nr:SigE family RNA polymerase sigma factor [Micromonospora ferruginea]QLQ38608.1 SigE family RNA polymerase sigma factor [Micromonospora ferruginea]